MIKHFSTLSITNKIAVVTAILAFLGVCVGVIALFKPAASTPTIVVPYEVYQQQLEQKQQQIWQLQQELAANPDRAQRRQELATELAAVQAKLHNVASSYRQYIAESQERIQRLQAFQEQVPNELIAAAQQALQKGDSRQADQLFAQIQGQTESPIQVAAEASFQRGQIAEEAIDFRQALQHYQRAVQLAPDNTLYLNDYGVMLKTMGQLDKAIDYYQQALASEIKTYGEEHPSTQTVAANLLAVQGQRDAAQ